MPTAFVAPGRRGRAAADGRVRASSRRSGRARAGPAGSPPDDAGGRPRARRRAARQPGAPCSSSPTWPRSTRGRDRAGLPRRAVQPRHPQGPDAAGGHRARPGRRARCSSARTSRPARRPAAELAVGRRRPGAPCASASAPTSSTPASTCCPARTGRWSSRSSSSSPRCSSPSPHGDDGGGPAGRGRRGARMTPGSRPQRPSPRPPVPGRRRGTAARPAADEGASPARMLLVAAVVYVLCRAVGDGSGAWGYVQAAAEASMVGGLADWFAVTALFRHPLRLPIPHTAIIPSKKDQIGEGLATFVQQYFLTSRDPGRAARRRRRCPQRVGEWLADPAHARRLAERARQRRRRHGHRAARRRAAQRRRQLRRQAAARGRHRRRSWRGCSTRSATPVSTRRR